MEKKYINNKQGHFKRVCKLYGRCGSEPGYPDSSKVTKFGLCCLNKHNFR